MALSYSPRPRADPRPLAAPRGVWLVALAVGIVVAVLAHLFAPVRPTPASEVTGDGPLAADVEETLGDRLNEIQGLAVARFDLDDPDAVEWAQAGTADGTVHFDEHTPVETGSIFKGITGMLLADMVAEGETTLDRTLADVLPEVDYTDPEVASITLEELATHHSGLGAVADPDLPASVLGTLPMTGPYRHVDAPLESLANAGAQSKGTYLYSNFGFAVLGEALAAEADTPYPELARERILDPLDMDDTVIAGEDLPEGAAHPYYEPGVRIAPWTNADYAPAGIGTWSTTADLTKLASGLTDGSAPGADSTDTVLEDIVPDSSGAVSSGLAWQHHETEEFGPVTLHGGMVYGASTMLLFNDDRAVVLMGNTAVLQESVLALNLLSSPEGTDPLSAELSVLLYSALVVFLLIVPPGLLISLAIRRRTLITQRPIDRLRVVSLSLGNLAWLAFLQRSGIWLEVHHVFFSLSAGAVAASLAVLAWHFVRVPTEAGRFRWLHVTVFVFSVLFSLTLGSLMTWGLIAAYL
ncbi:serine hydrolase domain-containing protein [Nocardiopsis nanhaiensis]